MFISYAQNFEDVMLNRLFPDKNSGFYIDVGAHHPVIDSVTKAFYERGWHGINVEPVKEYFELLKKERERDINLNIALGETESELEFYELESTGLSSFDQQTAYQLAEINNFAVKSYKVPLKKLGDICREKVKCQIDFLKIDVEGWEEKVILGHDWENFRPVVVVLEATIPNSPIRTETNIKSILASHNYFQVYFDGLNDYYLAQERDDLKSCFDTPPNVFDKFVRYSVIELQHQNQILHNQLKNKYAEVQKLNQNLAELQQKHNELRDRTANQITQYHNQIADLQSQLSQAKGIISGMESSKFWKLREAWFRLKMKQKE